MHLLSNLVCAWLTATWVAGLPPPSAAGALSFSVAVVRADRTVVPVGTFDGNAWAPLASAAGPGWHVWLLDDPDVKKSPFALRTSTPVTTAAVRGSDRCGLANGLSAAPGPDPLGVATSVVNVRVDLLTTLATTTDLGRWIVARGAPPFHRAEDDTLSVEHEELPSGFPAFATRQALPIVWTRIVRHGLSQSAARTFYLEGHKDYAAFKGRFDVGRIRTTGHVFLQIAGDRETADAEVDLSDVDGRQSIFRSPLAVIRAAEKSFWVFHGRSYGADHYEVMEVSGPSRRPLVVVQAPAGC